MTLLLLLRGSGLATDVPLGAVSLASTSSLFQRSVAGTPVSLRSESTWQRTKIGLKPASPFTATKTAATGTIARTSGSGAILGGNAAILATITLNTAAAVPVAADIDSRGFVSVFKMGTMIDLKMRRETGDVYRLVVTFGSSVGTAYMTVADNMPTAMSVGAAFTVATGAVAIYVSYDNWDTWMPVPMATYTFTPGSLGDADGEDVVVLGGDFQDGPWMQVFQVRVAETDDINDAASAEVLAWNCGSNLTNSPFDKADKSAQEFGTHSTSLVEQDYSRSYSGRTITCGWDMITPSPLQAGTDDEAAAFTYDACPLTNVVGAPVQSGALRMQGYGEFTADSYGYVGRTPDGQRPTIRVDILSPGGTRLCSLENAVVTNLTWELNADGLIEFSLPINDPKMVHLEVAEREVQVWRGTDLIHWGVVLRGTEQSGLVSFQCPGLSWYLKRRVVGTGETNKVLNGGFEAGDDYWFVGRYGLEPLASRDPSQWLAYTTPDRSISGSRSLYMYCTDAVVYGIYSFQFFFWSVDPASSPEGDTWNIVAWVYVPAGSTGRLVSYGDGTPTGYTGVTLTRHSTTEFTAVNIPGFPTTYLPKVIETVVMPISDDFPKDTWVRMEAPLRQPPTPGVTEWIQVMLGTPVGAVYYDEVSLVRNERLYFNNVDQATIVRGLVEHAQDTTIGKSDLRIGTYCPATGVLRTRIYEYANHEWISDCIDEWPQLFNGVDWSIEITPTTRTFVTHYPMKGARKPKQALVLGKNIASVSTDRDGTQTANSLIVMADGGDGAGREEALASDPTSLDDGLTLEMVYNATPGSSINSLQAQADRGLRRYRDPVLMPTLTTYDVDGDELFGRVTVGDIVPVNVVNGWATLIGDYRIIVISMNPQTGVLSLTINPYANWDLLP